MVVYTEPSNVEIDNVPVLPHSVKMMHQRTPKTPYGTHILKKFLERGTTPRPSSRPTPSTLTQPRHSRAFGVRPSLPYFLPSPLPQLFLSGAGAANPPKVAWAYT